MFILIDASTNPARLSLEEPELFNRFDVVVEGEADDTLLVSALARLGRREGTAHVFIDPVSLEALAGERARDGSWSAKLSEMIAFARSRGWIDDQGWIRAHIERSPA